MNTIYPYLLKHKFRITDSMMPGVEAYSLFCKLSNRLVVIHIHADKIEIFYNFVEVGSKWHTKVFYNTKEAIEFLDSLIAIQLKVLLTVVGVALFIMLTILLGHSLK